MMYSRNDAETPGLAELVDVVADQQEQDAEDRRPRETKHPAVVAHVVVGLGDREPLGALAAARPHARTACSGRRQPKPMMAVRMWRSSDHPVRACHRLRPTACPAGHLGYLLPPWLSRPVRRPQARCAVDGEAADTVDGVAHRSSSSSFVVLDPYTHESAWLLETAGRILTNFREADCRVAWLVGGTADEARRRSSVRWADDLLTFADPDRAARRRGLGPPDALPALVHIRQDLAVVGVAEGWDPPEWRTSPSTSAASMSWSHPSSPRPAIPARSPAKRPPPARRSFGWASSRPGCRPWSGRGRRGPGRARSSVIRPSLEHELADRAAGLAIDWP